MKNQLNLSQKDMKQVEINMKLRKIDSMDVKKLSLLAILEAIKQPNESDPVYSKYFTR